MDLDAFVAHNEPVWHRLDALVHRRRPTADEADELLDLYQRTSTHLSVVRSSAPDPSLVRYLSALLTRARIAQASRRALSWRDVLWFWTHSFPAALYRLRWWWLSVWGANLVVVTIIVAWTMHHPELYSQALTKAEIDRLVNTDFAGYYSEYAHHEFATMVWVNNAWVSALCIAMGVLGFPVVMLLWSNILNVGIIGALMLEHGRASLFFGMLLPHGLLELTAVFVAAGAGLRLFWSWIDPGARTRAQAFAEAGRTAIGIAMGLVAVLLVSGLIEGFVTPSDLPTWARVGIGVLALLAFLAYVFTLGRRAARQGVTGDLDRRDVGDTAPLA
ncbi:putative membrane protein [Nostocoides japonicum T1-X7]|uniref:Putative membrane protein n=1 Tax=Nostocoides japonicum T1-X7 TaxID=1194083 RepID=A0A077M0T8_9MICO|nr:stage II sporulation protein M [Tetrasphaera japonica]CCH79456.1 putative membrane protein [Tetrasphaera japonica T1-X7]CCH79984.1 putative membrane protein [Tetrasphaera japonica T1-X7]